MTTRARPLARRAAKIFRPQALAILLKNPKRRALFSFFGCQVRLTIKDKFHPAIAGPITNFQIQWLLYLVCRKSQQTSLTRLFNVDISWSTNDLSLECLGFLGLYNCGKLF